MFLIRLIFISVRISPSLRLAPIPILPFFNHVFLYFVFSIKYAVITIIDRMSDLSLVVLPFFTNRSTVDLMPFSEIREISM